MGCTCSRITNDRGEFVLEERNLQNQHHSASEMKPNRSSADGASYSIPFGHVPYNLSLPGAIGPIWGFPIE